MAILNKKKRLYALILLLSCHIPLVAAATLRIPDVSLHQQKKTQFAQYYANQRTQFSRVAIAATPIFNLQQLLMQEQSIARLVNTSGDDTHAALSIRGFGENASANSLILVDGFPLTNPSLMAPNINAIALIDMANMEIIQGSQGTLWGNQAVGGILNIITRHPNGYMADMQMSFGSYHKIFLNVLLGDKFAHGIYAKFDGFINHTDNFRQHNELRERNARGVVGVDYATGSLNVNAQTYNRYIELPGGLTAKQFKHDSRHATNHKNFLNNATQIYQVLYQQMLNADWLVENRLNRLSTSGNSLVTFPSNLNEWQNTFETRVIGHAQQNKIILGYFADHEGYQLTNRLQDNNTRAWQQNLFGQITVPLPKHVELLIGSRGAWQNNQVIRRSTYPVLANHQVWVGETGLNWMINEKIKFYLRRDGNFRFPKANEIMWTPRIDEPLTVQTGTSFETGGVWQNANQEWQLNLYHLALINEIAFNPTETPTQPFGSFFNFPRTVRNGFSITGTNHFTPALHLSATINGVDARFSAGEFSGNIIPAVPAWTGNANLAYEFLPHWFFKAYALYTGSRYASGDIVNVGGREPGYWLHNIALQFLIKPVDVSFEIFNLFNKRFATYTRYDAITHSNFYYPGTGRNFLLTFKLNLE